MSRQARVAVLAAVLVAVPLSAQSEDPRSHGRDSSYYNGPPGVPEEIPPSNFKATTPLPPTQPPAASAPSQPRPPAGATTPLDNPEFRFGHRPASPPPPAAAGKSDAPPPAKPPAASASPAKPPAASTSAKPPASATTPLDNPEFRFGQGTQQRRNYPREMLDGKPIWNTGDPPDKRGPFAFLGNKIGDPIAKMFPHPGTETDKYGMLLCRETRGIPGFLDCADDSLKEIEDGRWVMRFRGVEASFLNYRYLDGKLVGFDLGFPASLFTKMADAVDKIYGPASKRDKFDWRNLRGAGVDVLMLTWHTPHGAMVLRSHGAALESGMLSLFENRAEQRYAELRYKEVVVPDAPKPAAFYDPMLR